MFDRCEIYLNDFFSGFVLVSVALEHLVRGRVWSVESVGSISVSSVVITQRVSDDVEREKEDSEEDDDDHK